jgi:hypothetical protein
MWHALATSMACCSSFLTAADSPARGDGQIVSTGSVFPVSSSPLPSQPASRCRIAHIHSPRREHVPYLFSLARSSRDLASVQLPGRYPGGVLGDHVHTYRRTLIGSFSTVPGTWRLELTPTPSVVSGAVKTVPMCQICMEENMVPTKLAR